MLRKATGLTAMLATAIVVAACGGTSPSDKATASNTAARANDALKVSECMRSHGVPQFPDLGGSGSIDIQASSNGGNASISVNGHSINVSGPALQKAMQECRKYGPKPPPVSAAQLANVKQGALKMAQCMRSHGVPNFPDPKVTTGPGGRGIAVQIGGAPGSSSSPRGLNPGSPAFQNAQKVCGGLLGGLGPRSQKAAK